MQIELNKQHEKALEFVIRVVDSYFYNYENIIPEDQESSERFSLYILEELLSDIKEGILNE